MKIGEFVVDKSGRVVLPKKVRDLLKLKAGEALEVHLEGLRLIIQPAQKKGNLKNEDGVLVYVGSEPLTGEDFVAADREQRTQALLDNVIDGTKTS